MVAAATAASRFAWMKKHDKMMMMHVEIIEKGGDSQFAQFVWQNYRISYFTGWLYLWVSELYRKFPGELGKYPWNQWKFRTDVILFFMFCTFVVGRYNLNNNNYNNNSGCMHRGGVVVAPLAAGGLAVCMRCGWNGHETCFEFVRQSLLRH